MNLSSADEVRRLYDDSAESYNQLMDVEIHLPIYDEVLSNLAANLAGVSGAIVDSSCGTGHMLERIRGVYAPGRQLFGFDISPEMVEFARQRLGDAATILEGDMAALIPLADASCSCVITFFAIHHVDVETLQRCLTEWKRVLASGGHLLLAAWEGVGHIDYGGTSDVVARRYREAEIVDGARLAGFQVGTSAVAPVDEMEMDAVHLFATKM